MNTDARRAELADVAGGAACPGCGADIPDPGGIRQPHVGVSAGCWGAYGDLVAREYGQWANPPIHRVTVATYAAQHPGEEAPKSIHALAVHLITLYLVVERGLEPARAPREIGRAVADPSEFRWLDPPPEPEWLTILEVQGSRDEKEHTARVQRWARSVWEAWAVQHEVVRGWAGR